MKRFTETAKWDAPWFRELSPTAKLFWFYITDKCDHAGVWEVDFPAFQFYSGTKSPKLDELITELHPRLIWINEKDLFLVKFIEFQYGELSEACKPHRPVWKSLRKHNLLEKYEEGFQTLSKGYPNPIQRVSGTVKDKDKDKKMDKDKDLFTSVKNLYHEILPMLRKIKALGSSRKRAIRARYRENGENINCFKEIFEKVAEQSFLTGDNDRGWQADLDFILQPQRWISIMEGKYNRNNKATPNKALEENDHAKGF